MLMEVLKIMINNRIMNKVKINTVFYIGVVLFVAGIGITANAQTVQKEWQTRLAAKVSFDIIDNLSLEISPELRLDNDFKLDKYLLEGELDYQILKNISAGAGYRFLANKKNSGDTEYLHRYKFYAGYKHKIERWKPGFKLTYADYSDDEEEDSEFLRPKISVEYNIAKSKITPEVEIEYYYQIPSSDWYKVRYGANLDYKINKKNCINLGYKLDYYLNEYFNRNIIEVCYKLKF